MSLDALGLRMYRKESEKRDEVFVVRSYLQVHQLELESLGQQIRENKRNGRLVRTSLTSKRSLSTQTAAQSRC